MCIEDATLKLTIVHHNHDSVGISLIRKGYPSLDIDSTPIEIKADLKVATEGKWHFFFDHHMDRNNDGIIFHYTK